MLFQKNMLEQFLRIFISTRKNIFQFRIPLMVYRTLRAKLSTCALYNINPSATSTRVIEKKNLRHTQYCLSGINWGIKHFYSGM